MREKEKERKCERSETMRKVERVANRKREKYDERERGVIQVKG